MKHITGISVIIPAFNEETAVGSSVRAVYDVFFSKGLLFEIIVVDDGSTDATASVAEAAGARVISHPENLGYGAALKTGVSHASYDWIAIIDADGTYPVEEFGKLLEYIPQFDMVVGARTGSKFKGGLAKRISRFCFKWLAEYVTGRKIPDINSGMRIFRKDFVIAQFKHISSGFSFTTTLTLSMMLESKSVKYVPINYNARIGESHIRYLRDTLRAAQIMIQAIAWYNPIKLYLLLAITALLITIIAAVLSWIFVRFALQFIILWLGLLFLLLFFAIGMLVYVIRTASTDALSYNNKQII